MTRQEPTSFQPDTLVVPPQTVAPPRPRLPLWRLALPLLFQVGLITAIPAQSAYTYFTGRTVVLQTAPVDPYDLLRGYSQTLGYEVADVARLEKLPGGKQLKNQRPGTLVYVVLQAPQANQSIPPEPWQPIRIEMNRPQNLSSNQIALRGRYNGWQITYGLETYYMPEDQRDAINAEIGQLQRRDRQSFVVETKVDASGNAVPVSLWLRDRRYRF